MILFENIRLALFSLKANKMRALLTMLGIIIGIASVIAIMTVGDSLAGTVTSSMADMGANNITVYIQQKTREEEHTEDGMQFGEGNRARRNVTEDDLISDEMLRNYCDTYSDKILALSCSESVGSGKFQIGSKYANVNVTGETAGTFVASNLELLSGHYFGEKDYTNASMVCLISNKAVENLFDGDNEKAIGQSIPITINNKYYNFVVVGVYKYVQSAMGMFSSRDMTTDCYIPLKTARKFTHNKGFGSFTVVVNSGVDQENFANQTKNFLNTYYRNNDSFEIAAFNMASIVDIFGDVMGKITLAIAIIAGIALLVGGIGVMNIMLVSITERTREIGTRKALGAPNSSIRIQFIVESIVICLIGGIIGIILGMGLGILGSNLIGATATPSIKSIVISISFSMAIGVFFGYYPANKAAKMDPIEALRYE